MYRSPKGLGKIDRKYLNVWDERNTRGHKKKTKKGPYARKTVKIQLSI